MHAKSILSKLLGSVIYKSRLKLVIALVTALITEKKMTLTGLGRGLDRKIQERSAIRTVDRFLGNSFYQNHNSIIYKAISCFVIGKKKSPNIIVDWSKMSNTQNHILRASLAATGRAITIYEEVHPEKKLGNAIVQKKFLIRLKSLLPVDCKPVIVTDAGFATPWFKVVKALNWDFVGRIRQLNKSMYSVDSKNFIRCAALMTKATKVPKSIGQIFLGRRIKFPCWGYIVKKKIKGRKNFNKNGKTATSAQSKDYSSNAREGWLIVSSIENNCSTQAKRVIEIYSQRMTIEEAFRDLKSKQYAFGMEENKTLKKKRCIVWLMLAALANLIAWIVGYCAEAKSLQYQFQANSISSRRVLSLVYLGCQIIKKKVEVPISLLTIDFFQEKAA